MKHLRLLLLPFSWIYATIAWMRNGLYDSGVLKKNKFNLPVILVGNLSVGGTGKTPHVEYLIRLLQNRFRVATLSRGYGRKSTGCVIAGKGTTAEIIGDEPMQYYTKFPAVTVAVCENRSQGITKLLDLQNKPHVIVMDDGFQHRSVEPGFRILLTSFDKLFTRDFVLPAGDLREPAFGYKRADCIVVTRTPEGISEKEKEKVRKELHPTARQELYFSSLEYDDPVPCFEEKRIRQEELSLMKVVLFTGIADPGAMIHHLKRHCADVHHISFPDHHPFSEKDMQKVKSASGADKLIITTEKDFLRLKNTPAFEVIRDLSCYYLPIRVKIDREEDFNKTILSMISRYKP
jgi:tetraacyldisaccharide 4'-kinase